MAQLRLLAKVFARGMSLTFILTFRNYCDFVQISNHYWLWELVILDYIMWLCDICYIFENINMCYLLIVLFMLQPTTPYGYSWETLDNSRSECDDWIKCLNVDYLEIRCLVKFIGIVLYKEEYLMFTYPSWYQIDFPNTSSSSRKRTYLK